MSKKAIILLLSFLPFVGNSAEYEFGLGAGLQYGGLIGTQHAIKFSDSKLYASVGLFGVSVGGEKSLSDNNKHTGGALIGAFAVPLTLSSFKLLTYNYHFEGFEKSGWVIGIAAGRFDVTTTGVLSETSTKERTSLALNLGYKF